MRLYISSLIAQLRSCAVVPVSVLAVSVLLFAGASHAQDADTGSLQPLPAEEVDLLEESFAALQAQIAATQALQARVDAADGSNQELLQARVSKSWAKALEGVTSFAARIADKQEAGFDVSVYMTDVTGYLTALPAAIEATAPAKGKIDGIFDNSRSALDIAIFDQQLFARAKASDDGSWAVKRGIDAANRLGIDTTSQMAYLAKRAREKTENASVLLDLAMMDVQSLRAAVTVLPNDTEVMAKLKLAEKRVRNIAAVIENNLPLLKFTDSRVSEYNQQLLAATGQLSAGSLDAEVVSGLIAQWTSGTLDVLKVNGPNFLFRLFIFLAIIFISAKLASVAKKLVKKGFASSHVKTSELLERMVTTVSYNVVIIIGILMALSQIGISLGPLLTGLGIAGFIVGFALQDSLANFASGMLILIYRPYDIGDTVEVSGVFGVVEKMSLVNTTILTLDNQTLIIPNNKIWQDVIKNLTYQKVRRVDLVFGITYDQNIDVVEKILREVVEGDERVLDDPEVNIRVHELGDSSVNLIVRPWVKTEDYWDVYWDLTKRVKQRFDAEGVVIPFPQRDVHHYVGDAVPALSAKGFDSDADPSQNSATGIIDNDEPSAEEDG